MSEGPSPLRRKSSRIIDTSALKDGDGAPSNSSDSIKVLCRFRPIRTNAKSGSSDQNVFNLNAETGEVEYASYYADKKTFKFDKVFGENTEQVQVFDEVKGVVGAVLGGFNGTIMAYGQTSAGKSFTMEGLSLWEGENQGLIPRCVNLLFEEIAKSDSNLQFQVVVSFFEVYCEKLRDLLNPQAVNLKLRETKDNGFVVQDITEIYCTDRDSVMRVIEFGKANRASAPTLMNAESSRSHSIVSIFVDQKDTVSGRQKRGNLFLVDLAGSEKVSKTGASGMRLEEAKNINSSLTTLGMVINALCDGAGHVPYRDSKLTMILMEALGGNSKTTLIICCTKENSQQSETLSTLRFGERAKKIQNHAKVNEELSVGELKALLAAAQKEIASLKKKLAGFRKSLKPGEMPELGLDDDAENKALNDEAVADLRRQIEEGTHRVTELQQDIDGLKARLSVTEEELESERIRFRTEEAEKNDYFAENNALRTTIAELEDKLVKQSLDMKKAVAKSVEEAEKALEQYDEDALSKELADVSELASAVDDGTTTTRQRRSGASSSQDGTTKTALRAAILEKAEALEASLKAEAGDTSTAPVKSPSTTASPVGKGNGIELNKLQQESMILNAQMEAEILHLNQSVSQQAQEARNAMETAQKYADKYLKLREEYEMHIERLMLKLTQEQQARTILEDQLESAMRKVFLFSKEIEKQRGGFFGWFSRKPTDLGGSSSTSRSKAANDREMGMARSLELANLRIQQLQAENDQLKESHGIVVETKESVINTLSKRVTELSNERDLFKNRMEDLTATVEQLTNLLRSTQNHGVGAPGTGFSGGGGGMSGGGVMNKGGGGGHFAQGMIKGGGSFFVGGGMKGANSSSFMNAPYATTSSAGRFAPSTIGSQRGGSIASVSSARTSSLGSDDDDMTRGNVPNLDEAEDLAALMNDDHASIASSSTDSQDSNPQSVQTIYSATTQATTLTNQSVTVDAMPARPTSTGRRPLPPLPPPSSQSQASGQVVNGKLIDAMLSSSSSPVAETMFLSQDGSASRDSDDSSTINNTGPSPAATSISASPVPRLSPSTSSRPPIFPPSPSTAAALAATAAIPSTMSNSIAQRMAGVIKTPGTVSTSSSSDRLSNLDAANANGNSSAAGATVSASTSSGRDHRPTLNLAALSAGKVRPPSTDRSGLSPVGSSTPTAPSSTTTTTGLSGGFSSNFAAATSSTGSGATATSSFASRLSGVLDTPLSSATSSGLSSQSGKRVSIGESLGIAAPAPSESK